MSLDEEAAASLPDSPSSSSSLPPPAQSTCSAGRSDPTHTTPPTALVQSAIGSRPARQPVASPPSPGVNTFAFWLAPRPRRHTSTFRCFGREKALWIPAKQSIAAEVCARARLAERRAARSARRRGCSLGRYGNKMPLLSVYRNELSRGAWDIHYMTIVLFLQKHKHFYTHSQMERRVFSDNFN